MGKWWIRYLILCVTWNVLICGNAIGQTNQNDIIIEREVYEKVLNELKTLDSIRKENEVLREEVGQLQGELNSLSGEITDKQKALANLHNQIEQNLDTTDDLVKELRSQVKLLNIAKKEQKELLRKYKRRRWTQEEKRVGVAFLLAVLGMSITIAVSNLTN